MSDKIKDAIRMMSKETLVQTFQATVKSVDEEKGLCDVVSERSGLETFDVMLTLNPESSIAVPEVNSRVIVGIIENMPTHTFIISIEKIAKYKFVFSDSVMFNGDSYGGLVVAGELRKELNKSKNRIDNIISILKNTITAVSLYPNPAWSATILPLLESLVSENYENNDIENKKLRHGE